MTETPVCDRPAAAELQVRRRTVRLTNSTVYADNPNRLAPWRRLRVTRITEMAIGYEGVDKFEYRVILGGTWVDEKGNTGSAGGNLDYSTRPTFAPLTRIPADAFSFLVGPVALRAMEDGADLRVEATCEPVESQPVRTARLHREQRDQAVRDALTALKATVADRYWAATEPHSERAYGLVIDDINGVLTALDAPKEA